jgi:C1A family cysteine protease
MSSITKLNEQLERQGAKWRAAETSISHLSTAEFKKRLGWIPKPISNPEVKHEKWSASDPYDAVVDWRNRNGKNYVSPVVDQGGCGCCATFATVAQVESMARIEKNAPIKLSEADLAFCGTHTNNCLGWNQDDALTDVEGRGIVSEGRLPYLSVFPDGNTGKEPIRTVIPNHDHFSVKVSSHIDVADVDARKSYISNVGPMNTGLIVYDDFSTYSTGIYIPSLTSKELGGHNMVVIGYSDIEQYWLFKNSYGPNWGEQGFCKIAYNACQLDVPGSYFTGCTGVEIPDMVPDETIAGTGQVELSSMNGTICLDGFYSPDDTNRHAIIGSVSGAVTEIFYNPQTGQGRSLLTTQHHLLDLGAFYTPDDKFRHVITADNAGNIAEVFYSPSTGIGNAPLGNIPGASRVCGFYTDDDKDRHAIIATTAGAIIEVFYNNNGRGQSQIGSLKNVVDIGGFYSSDDKFRHVIVGTADGNITEIYYDGKTGIHSTVIANIPGLKKVSAFYTADHHFYNRRILILTSTNTVVEIRYDPTNGIITNRLFTGDPAAASMVDIGGFYSPDDQDAHCIVAMPTGDIKEVFY